MVLWFYLTILSGNFYYLIKYFNFLEKKIKFENVGTRCKPIIHTRRGMEVKNLVVCGVLQERVEVMPEGFEGDEKFPEYTRKVGEVTITLFPKKDTFFVQKKNPGDVEAWVTGVPELLMGVGLRVVELEISNMVTYWESGIRNPKFAEATVFDTRREDRHREQMAKFDEDIAREQRYTLLTDPPLFRWLIDWFLCVQAS